MFIFTWMDIQRWRCIWAEEREMIPGIQWEAKLSLDFGQWDVYDDRVALSSRIWVPLVL